LRFAAIPGVGTMMLLPQYAIHNSNLSPAFRTTNVGNLLHQLHWCYVGWAGGMARPGSSYSCDACRSATRSSPSLVPRLVQIRVKNTCGHRRVKLGMAAIEKL